MTEPKRLANYADLKVAISKGFKKKDEGYFDKLGINAIWVTPIVEQIHDAVDEGTGLSYGFHGYWTRDWTALDPNFGTKDLANLVQKHTLMASESFLTV
jgi:maltooligosyltrehalose synthase